MMKINLLDNFVADPIVESPSEAKKRFMSRKWNVSWCSCGKHPVNPNKDVYVQHNLWVRQQMNPVETGGSQLHHVQGIGASIPKYELSYDFSGDEFEMNNTELRRFNEGKEE